LATLNCCGPCIAPGSFSRGNTVGALRKAAISTWYFTVSCNSFHHVHCTSCMWFCWNVALMTVLRVPRWIDRQTESQHCQTQWN
jgi:hypothetical protein